jgi:hypothetical protein
MAKRLATLEQVKGLCSGLVYAEQYEAIALVSEHDDEISIYKNLRTGEKFHCRKSRVLLMDEAMIISFVETDETKKKKGNSTKRKTDAINQLSIF